MSNIFSWITGKNKSNSYTMTDMMYFLFIILNSEKYNTLIKNRVVTSNNQLIIIETLRTLAEIMVYGDKNSEQFFEYFNCFINYNRFFCEKRMITLMIEYLHQDCANSVKIQVIQTMSILVQNIKSETTLSIYFIY